MEEQLAALAALPDDQIDLSDAPELSDEQRANAERGKFYRPLKQHLSVPMIESNEPPRGKPRGIERKRADIRFESLLGT
jgi:hypothetical protein